MDHKSHGVYARMIMKKLHEVITTFIRTPVGWYPILTITRDPSLTRQQETSLAVLAMGVRTLRLEGPESA